MAIDVAAHITEIDRHGFTRIRGVLDSGAVAELLSDLGRIETEEGLNNMYHRVPSVDLDLVKTSVGIAADVGGNLAEVFDRIDELSSPRLVEYWEQAPWCPDENAAYGIGAGRGSIGYGAMLPLLPTILGDALRSLIHTPAPAVWRRYAARCRALQA